MLSLSSLYSNRSYKRNEKSSGWFLQVNILSRIGSGGEGTKEGYSSDFFQTSHDYSSDFLYFLLCSV